MRETDKNVKPQNSDLLVNKMYLHKPTNSYGLKKTFLDLSLIEIDSFL